MPTAIYETVSFDVIQSTAVFQHDSLKSDEVNKLLESFGIGGDFISSNFEISLGSYTNLTTTVYAILKPGIFVQDSTVINFQDHMVSGENINIKLYNTGNEPDPGDVIYVGSQYYHGTYGDGINATPTHATIIKTSNITTTPNFVPFYKITFFEGYTGISDLTNLKIERVIPSLKYNGCGTPDVLYTCSDDGLKVYGDDSGNDDALIWSLIFGN